MKQQLQNRIAVITPTLNRPHEVSDLFHNLSQETILPALLVVVDGAPADVKDTEDFVTTHMNVMPFPCCYIRNGGGTAIQRNVGVDTVVNTSDCDYIAFVDDDIRLEPDFFEIVVEAFGRDEKREIGGITGYITNQHLDPNVSRRWTWNRRLHLYSIYEPGRYDFETGYPINRYLQPPHTRIRQIDFMGAGCAVWRREVFLHGLRFSHFFTDYGVLEDAHFALRAGRQWKLFEDGNAHCIHLKSQAGRESKRITAQRTALNYRYVFMDIVPKRGLKRECRFWLIQFIELFRFTLAAISGEPDGWGIVIGKLEGIAKAFRLQIPESD